MTSVVVIKWFERTRALLKIVRMIYLKQKTPPENLKRNLGFGSYKDATVRRFVVYTRVKMYLFDRKLIYSTHKNVGNNSNARMRTYALRLERAGPDLTLYNSVSKIFRYHWVEHNLRDFCVTNGGHVYTFFFIYSYLYKIVTIRKIRT